MREATGNALLTMIVAATITIIMVFFVGTLSYSKSYKIKNYIIDEIERNRGWSSSLEQSIDEHLKDVGYNIKSNRNCEVDRPKGGKAYNCSTIVLSSAYNYCVYACSDGVAGEGVYMHYTVVTYMNFDFPVINDSVRITVKGSTKNFFTDGKGNVITYFNK